MPLDTETDSQRSSQHGGPTAAHDVDLAHSPDVARRASLAGLRKHAMKAIAIGLIAAWLGGGSSSAKPDVGEQSQPGSAAGSAQRPPTGVGSANPADEHRHELVARAKQALAQRWPLDYGRPLNNAPYDEAPLRAAFVEACRAGDKPSCWMASALEDSNGKGPSEALVIENCRRGDLMSCRAVNWPTPDLPGAIGHSDCDNVAPAKPCDLAGLRRECDTGFAPSCKVLHERLPEQLELDARTEKLGLESCEVGNRVECRLVWQLSDTNRLAAAQSMCPLIAGGCNALAGYYQDHNALLQARDLRERICQYAVDTDGFEYCRELISRYRGGELPEPSPGRADALESWLCEHPHLADALPECAAQIAKHRADKRKPR